MSSGPGWFFWVQLWLAGRSGGGASTADGAEPNATARHVCDTRRMPVQKLAEGISPAQPASHARRHPSIGFYNNEPFDCYYHRGSDLSSVLDHLQNSSVRVPGVPGGQGLLIKDMTFQADIYFRLLADLTTSPPIFILRDPRLSIASRMRMVADAGGDPLFPHRETGWSALYQQIQACRSQNLPYILINADDFRRNPVPVLSRLFALSSLSFSSRQLNWRPAPAMRMGNMDGAQDNFYVRVLNSQGLEPATESSPSLELFPAHTGLRSPAVGEPQVRDMLLYPVSPMRNY